jgi:hypothetical protein
MIQILHERRYYPERSGHDAIGVGAAVRIVIQISTASTGRRSQYGINAMSLIIDDDPVYRDKYAGR